MNSDGTWTYLNWVYRNENQLPRILVKMSQTLVGISRYVSHVGTSWILTLNSLIITLVVDFCPRLLNSPVHLQGGGMYGHRHMTPLRTVFELLVALSTTSSRNPRAFGKLRTRTADVDRLEMPVCATKNHNSSSGALFPIDMASGNSILTKTMDWLSAIYLLAESQIARMANPVCARIA